ncbi:MAG: hypothetical protein JRG96_11085 [Deltaproteobacteria bacterium]|nr:hypothetical protein [Deltaproteobacteria bacterium]MBW2360674.1 hypothetical protein [Deltaproteobacteria bacterium]
MQTESLFHHRRLNGWVLLAWTAAALFLQIGLGLGIYGTGEEGLRVCARGTLRIGLVLFIGTLVASSVLHFSRGEFAKWLMRNRRQLGFSFGCAHFFHIGFIVLLDRAGFIPAERDIFREGGVVIYAFIGLMMLTSFDATTRPLPRWLWVGLHKWGLYSIWVAFAVAYLGRVAQGTLFYVPFAATLLLGMAGRWWVGIARFRTKRAAALGV